MSRSTTTARASVIDLRVRLHVAPSTDDDQRVVEGVVIDDDGRETPFTGWLELLAVLEGATTTPAH